MHILRSVSTFHVALWLCLIGRIIYTTKQVTGIIYCLYTSKNDIRCKRSTLVSLKSKTIMIIIFATIIDLKLSNKDYKTE